MSVASRIGKIRPQPLPRRVAWLQIEVWQNAIFLGAEISNPSDLVYEQRKMMIEDIKKQCNEPQVPEGGFESDIDERNARRAWQDPNKTNEMIKGALREVFFLKTLYAQALSGLLYELLRAFQLVAFSVSGPIRNAGLFPYLTEAHNALSREIAIVNLVEETYLKSPILPPSIRKYAEQLQENCRSLRKSFGAELPREGDLYDPEDRASEAIETVNATVRNLIDQQRCDFSWASNLRTIVRSFRQLQYLTEVSNITFMAHALPKELKKPAAGLVPNNFDEIDAFMKELSRKVEARTDRDSRGNKSRSTKPATRKPEAAA